MKKDPHICPQCKTDKNVIPIIYGMANWELGEQAKKNQVKLGGCCVSDDDPVWYCKACEIEFSGGA
jgi:ribosomal protein L37AE/L43A